MSLRGFLREVLVGLVATLLVGLSNLSAGRAELPEIYSIVRRIRPKTPNASIRSDLYRGIDKGLFRRFSDGSYGRGETVPLDFQPSSVTTNGLILEQKLLERYTPTEKELEEAFTQNYRLVFDETALYIPIKKMMGQTLKKVTDGLMLDLDEKGRGRFWIVEFELSSHDLESPVQAQVLGFDGQQKKMYPRPLEPYQYLDSIFHGKSGVMIVIDEVTAELREVVASLAKLRPVRLVEFKAFRGNGKKAYTFSHADIGRRL